MSSSDTFLKEMGRRIARMRKEMQLSQEELAEIAGVSPQMLSTAERGTKNLRSENLLKLSRALSVSADYLLTGEKTCRDLDPLSQKLQHLSEEQLLAVEKIVDACITLSE